MKILKWIVSIGLICFLLLLGLVVLTSVGLFAANIVLQSIFPAASAEFQIPEIDTTIQIRLYASSPIGAAEYHRELIVRSPTGALKRMMSED